MSKSNEVEAKTEDARIGALETQVKAQAATIASMASTIENLVDSVERLISFAETFPEKKRENKQAINPNTPPFRQSRVSVRPDFRKHKAGQTAHS